MTLTKLDIDRNINTLRVNSKEFSTIDSTKLISMLEESISNIKDVAYYWATVSADNKGVTNTTAEGEEWLGGPFATVFGIQYYIDTLKDLKKPLNEELFNNKLNTLYLNLCFFWWYLLWTIGPSYIVVVNAMGLYHLDF